MFKIVSTYIKKKNIYIYKMQHRDGSGTPALYIGGIVVKG
jgi:hypothetical protein